MHSSSAHIQTIFSYDFNQVSPHVQSPTHFSNVRSLFQISPLSFSTLSLSKIANLLSFGFMIADLLFLTLIDHSSFLSVALNDHGRFHLILVISAPSIDLNDCRFFLSLSVIVAFIHFLSVITASLVFLLPIITALLHSL